MMFLSAGFFVFSINHATASAPDKFMMQGSTGKLGKYSLQTLNFNNAFEFYMTDSETGKTFWWDKENQKCIFKTGGYGFPAIPVGE